MGGSILIIAEAGVNHNGSVENAKNMIDVAVMAGADYIKFQTFKTEKNISLYAPKADYQKDNPINDKESLFDMIKKLELSFEDFKNLKKYCEKKGIGFLSTGYDIQSINFLDELDQNFFKIPSGEITNKPYLQHIARKGKPVIMSSGMATMAEIKAAMDVLIEQGLTKDLITVLHCNTEYPTPMKDVNLKAMVTIQKELRVNVGYSDHTLGIEVPIAAVVMGAKIIEKHFTLDHSLPGPDHKASLEPDELKSMVKAIRNVEMAIKGSGIKEPSQSEKHNIVITRKSIYLNQRVDAGTVLTEEHLIMKRPGNGISPMEIEKVIGKKLSLTLEADSLLLWDHLKK